MKYLVLTILFVYALPLFSQSVRIKDITKVRGVRDNQLVGFGLIIGLQGTGDSPATIAGNVAVKNMLKKLGMKPPKKTQTTASMAAVIVTAKLASFKRNGDLIDVSVSTIGDASSLAGGTLLMTPLKAGDGRVYVVAHGSVATSGATGSGEKVLTNARVPSGGTVEREFKPLIAHEGKILLSIYRPDFTVSTRVADRINFEFKGFYAKALDPVSIEVQVPSSYADQVPEFIAAIEPLKVDVDQKAVVVVNEKTGTVVMGSKVIISSVAISHGQLSIKIDEKRSGNVAPPKDKTTVGEFVETMNALGVQPSDMVAILQAIHAAGALQAELRFL